MAIRGLRKWALVGAGLLAAAAGCAGTPESGPPLPASSAVLAADVRFPTPLARDHSLVQIWFAKEPIATAKGALPELLPATFVKRSRGYLLDPEPGSYVVVAVGSNIAPSWNRGTIAGVDRTVANDDPGHVVVLPAELAERTRTEVRAGGVAFVGRLEVRRGAKINADASGLDALQRGVADRIRPDVTDAAGFEGWNSMTWAPDAADTRLRRDGDLRDAFFREAIEDLGRSRWAGFLERAAPRAVVEARALERERSRRTNPPLTKRQTRPAPPPVEPSGTAAGRAGPESDPARDPVAPEPAPESALAPDPAPFPGVPADSPLARISPGMHHGDVSRILGEPAERVDRLTRSAWIPFNTGRGARLIDWIYPGLGRVTFSMETGTLRVFEVVKEGEDSQAGEKR